MNHFNKKRSARMSHTPLTLWGQRQIQRVIQVVKACPRLCAQALWKPSAQYRIALVLVTLLVFLLCWLLTLPPTAISMFRGAIC